MALITFVARDSRQAQSLIDGDAFKREGLLDSLWLEEWAPTTAVIAP